MANWSNPLLTSTYTNFLTEVKDRDTDLALQFDGTTSSNIPTGAIRWSSSVNRWQKWSGSAWGELTSTYALTGLTTTGNATIGGTLGSGAFTSSGTVTGTALLPTGNTVPANGIYLPSANTLGIATATTCRILVASDGKVGIGITTPGQALDVKGIVRSSAGTGTGAGGAGYAFYQFGTSATATENWHIGTEGDGSFRFYNGNWGAGSNYLHIGSTGNVGIGGFPTAVKLYVYGQIVGTNSVYALRASNGSGTGQTSIGLTREGASTDQKTWELVQGGSGEFLLRTINDGYSASQNAIVVNRGSSYNVDSISLLTMGSSRLYINSSGGVGIGTTAPSNRLHASGSGDVIRVDSSTTDAGLLFYDSVGSSRIGTRSASIIFDTNSFERVRITSSGDVGIGTITPSVLLHVAGQARIGASNTNDAELQIGAGATGNRNAYIDLVGDTTYTDYGLRLIRSNGGANGASILTHKGTGPLEINCEEAGTIAFRTSNTTRAFVSSTGYVGIGVTNPAAGFHVGSTAAGASIGNIYIKPTTAGQARYHLYNGGAQAEWLLGQKTSTDHDFKLSTQVAGNEVDRLIVTTDGTLKFNSGYGVNVVATAYGCRAWVNFDGTGTTGANQTIRASGNIASVYKNGAGDYTVTFTNAMPDANYAVNATLEQAGRDNWASISDLTTTTFKVYSKDNTLGLEDSPRICITVTR